MLDVALDPVTVAVAVDPRNVMNRVWVSNGDGLLEVPVSLPAATAGSRPWNACSRPMPGRPELRMQRQVR